MTNANVEKKKKKQSKKKTQKTNHTLNITITQKMKYASGNKSFYKNYILERKPLRFFSGGSM